MGIRAVVFSLLHLLIVPGVVPIYAQQTVMEGALPDSIVVTASRREDDIRSTARRVSVWTAQEIASQPVSSVDELLRIVGGVEVQSRGGFGVQSDLTMRGSGFNGVLVLLDGARINDPMTGHFLSDLPLPLSDIARIEVVRGPATAIYGPDALGGVIQIFTFTGLEKATAPSSLGGSANVRVGHHDYYDVDAALRRSGSSMPFSVATTWQGSDGMPITGQNGQVIRSTTGEVRTDFSRQAHSAALVKAFQQNRMYVRVGMDHRSFGAFHFYSPFPSDTARETTSTYWAQARLDHEYRSGLHWQGQIAAKEHRDEYIYNPQTPANRHISRMLGGQFQVSKALGKRASITTGTSGEIRGIDSNNLGEHQDISGGVFLLTRWLPIDELSVNASGRLDYDPGYGLEATPQLGVAYNFQAVTVRAVVGRAVRAPNYVERYFNTRLARPRGRSLGNPNLNAETAWAYEAGLDVYPIDGFSAHLTGFTRTTNNLIDYAKLTPADTVFLARNILSVETRGLEVDVELDRSLAENRMQVSASYAYLQADLGAVPEGITYQYVLTNARHLLQIGAAFHHKAAVLSLHTLWKDRLQGDPYTVVNLRLGYRVNLGRQRLFVTGEIRNVFDKAYTEVFDAPMPGRWWLLGLQLAR